MDNYLTIERKLRELTPFKGNSLHAYWSDGALYVVSYSTLIAYYSTVSGEKWLKREKYSTTTSRHQNLIRRAWGIA